MCLSYMTKIAVWGFGLIGVTIDFILNYGIRKLYESINRMKILVTLCSNDYPTYLLTRSRLDSKIE